jgi:GAF domain-containing protein
MALHRLKEWRNLRQESAFASTIAELFQEVVQLEVIKGAETNNQEVLQDFIRKVLVAFRGIFHSKGNAQFNIMVPDGETLKLSLAEPADAVYLGKSFAPGSGGAGTAFQKKVTVYFPAVRYRHGISVIYEHHQGVASKDYDLLESIYEETGEAFRSLVCVPIRRGTEIVGILNIDSRKQNAFTMTDIDIAQVAASAIGMAIDRCAR